MSPSASVIVRLIRFSILHGLAEFKNTPTDAARQSRYFPRTEQQQEQEDYNKPYKTSQSTHNLGT